MPRTNKSKHALLALLSLGPRSGYDIQRDIQRTIGHFWNESYGQIYPMLRRIVDEGLATVRKEPQEGKPDRKIYTITGKGKQALASWLEVEPEPPPVRNEMLLKLFVGWQTSIDQLIDHIEGLASGFASELGYLTGVHAFLKREAEQNPDALYWLMTLRSGQLYTEARVQWCKEAIAILKKMKKRAANQGGVSQRSKRMAELLDKSRTALLGRAPQ